MSFITPSIVVTADIVKVEALPPRSIFPQAKSFRDAAKGRSFAADIRGKSDDMALHQSKAAQGAKFPRKRAHAAQGALPSMGSKLHMSQQCRPCAHSWKPGGCFKGKDCEFCHTCDEKDFRRFQRSKIANRNKLNTRKPWWQAPHEPEWEASWEQLGDWSCRTEDSELHSAGDSPALHLATPPAFTPLASTRSSMASSSGDSDLVPTPGVATWPPLLWESEPPLPPLEVETMFHTMTQPCLEAEKVHAVDTMFQTMTQPCPDMDKVRAGSVDSNKVSSHEVHPAMKIQGTSLIPLFTRESPKAGAVCFRIKNTFLDLDDLGKEDVVFDGDPKLKRSSSCPAVLQQVDTSVEGLPARSTAWIPLHRSLATWSSEEVPDAHCSDIVWCRPNGAAAAAEEQWLSEIVSMPM